MSTSARFRAMAIRRLGLEGDGGVGNSLKLIKRESNYDPTTSKTVITEEVFDTSGVRINYKHYDLKNTSIQDTDIQFYVSPVCTKTIPDPDWVPEEGQTESDRPNIEESGDTPEITPAHIGVFFFKGYTVVASKPLYFSGLVIRYNVHALLIVALELI